MEAWSHSAVVPMAWQELGTRLGWDATAQQPPLPEFQ